MKKTVQFNRSQPVVLWTMTGLLLLLGSANFSLGQTVSMTNPTTNSSFIEGTAIGIAGVIGTPASVTKVELFDAVNPFGTYTKVGEVLTAGAAAYSFAWTAPSAVQGGTTHRLRAVLTTTTSTTAVQTGTGYNSITVYPAANNAPRDWYVSATASAANTLGTLASPLNTIQKAADQVAPGDVVYLMATGSFTTATNEVAVIRRTGTASQPIVFRPYTTAPVLQMGSTNNQVISMLAGAAYIRLQGLDITGNNATITLAEAQAQPAACNVSGSRTTRFNGNGIYIDGTSGDINRPHHITIAGNTIHDCGAAGIVTSQCDYITIEDNTIANNCWYSVAPTNNGMTIQNSWNYDNTAVARFIIRRNKLAGNSQKVTTGTGTCVIGNGHGFVPTANATGNATGPAYTGKILFENNLVYLNGGRGININATANMLVINNTTYQNGQTDTPSNLAGELVANTADNARIYNNIFYTKSGTGEVSTSFNTGTGATNGNNLTYNINGNGNGSFTVSPNIVGQDPLFVDAANANFQIAANSPAVNAGSNITDQFATTDIAGTARPQGAGVDIGAYELSSAAVTITRQPASASAVCVGGAATVSVGVSGSVQGYQWYKDGAVLTGVASATTPTLLLTNLTAASAGSYSVVVTATPSLTSTAFVLTVNALPPAALLPATSTISCANPAVTLTASGGTSYAFSGGSPQGPNQTVVSVAGTYSVTVTDANGCKASAPAIVSPDNTVITANITASPGLTATTGNSVTLTTSGGNAYRWSTSETTDVIVVTTAGPYSVTVTGAGGCSASTTATVVLVAPPTVSMNFPRFNSSVLVGAPVVFDLILTTPANTSITKVEYFAGGTGTVPIGTVTSAPFNTFTYTVSGSLPVYNQFKVIVTNSAGGTAGIAGGSPYNAVYVYPVDYMGTAVNYYVSPAPLGNDANNGTSPATPYATIQKAADKVAPGDVVYVMAGTYTNTATNDIVALRRTGTPTRWIEFRPYQNDQPKLQFNGWQAFELLPCSAYIKINGFEIVGNNANVILAQATSQPGSCDTPTGSVLPAYNGNGIQVSGRTGGALRSHHITLANNIIHDCGGAGISAIEGDYITVENNTIYNTSWYSIYGTSGISFLSSWNSDNSTATKMIIRNNRLYGNKELVPVKKPTYCDGITDGNGIILDNNNLTFSANEIGVAYLGAFLVENNLCYLNGGRGINLNYSDNATVRNNTCYQNAAVPDISSEYVTRYSDHARVYNNIFWARSDKPVTLSVGSMDLIQNNNLTFGGNGTGINVFTGNQSLSGNPRFADAANANPALANFQLLLGSPALDAGSSTPGQYALTDFGGNGRPQGTGIDIGAYEPTPQQLPVTLREFSAKPLGGQVAVVWITASEQNSAYFEVERSRNLSEFGPVGRVAAAGESKATLFYKLLDENPLANTSYYRLKQVDRDGTFAYSKIVPVVLDNVTPSMELLGNPAETTTIRIITRNLDGASYDLTTGSGQSVGLTVQPQPNGTLTLLPMQPLPAGVYLLQARLDGLRVTQKVLIP